MVGHKRCAPVLVGVDQGYGGEWGRPPVQLGGRPPTRSLGTRLVWCRIARSHGSAAIIAKIKENTDRKDIDLEGAEHHRVDSNITSATEVHR
jgi:hypothetical protein